MSINCFFCKGPVNPHDLGTWKQVAGWVGGERKDSMTMRDDTGEYAHAACIEKARKGQPADQPSLDEAVYPSIVIESGPSDFFLIDPKFTELMADPAEPIPPTETKSLNDLLGRNDA